MDHLEHSGKNVVTGRKLAAAQTLNCDIFDNILSLREDVRLVPIGANFHIGNPGASGANLVLAVRTPTLL